MLHPKQKPHSLSHDQQRAFSEIAGFIDSGRPAHVLTGGAGTGKTTLLGTIASYADEQGVEVALSATTHKAATVLAEKTGRPCRTLHSLLGLRPKAVDGKEVLKRVGTPTLPEFGLLIVDESSMVDGELLKMLMADASAVCGVLFVGDRFQLPPVSGRSAVFNAGLPTSTLTQVLRQAEGNPIIAEATRWRQYMRDRLEGDPPECSNRLTDAGDGIELVDRATFDAMIRNEFKRAPESTKVLGFTNAAVASYNSLLRPLVLGHEALAEAVLPGETLVANNTIAKRDEIILGNNQEIVVHTADRATHPAGLDGYEIETLCGRRLFIAADHRQADAALKALASDARALQRRFDGGDTDIDADRRRAWRALYELKESVADLRPPFASTVHKAQGSTFRTVFLDLADIGRCPGRATRARLMYTALTRASHKVVACAEVA